MKKLGLIAGAALCASIAGAQSFNVDLDGTGGVWSGPPSSTYGAAGGAMWAGTWNALPDVGGNGLTDTSGAVTGVNVGIVGGFGIFGFNNAGTVGDDELLLDDYKDVGGTGGAANVTFTNLANGPYDVIVYAWAPDSGAFISNVVLNGNGQAVGGVWGGGFAQGVTHAMFSNVNVAGGTLSFDVLTFSGFGTINGFQIRAVPEPGTIAAFAIGGLTLLALRRRK